MQIVRSLIAAALPFESKHASLVYQLVRREIGIRFKGSILGVLWALATPLLTLVMYTLVFGTFMKAKWTGVDGTSEFALVLFPGLIIFTFFSECINRAPSLIFSNPNFVKKVVFPLELLVWVPIGTALFHLFIGSIVWMVMTLVMTGSLHWTTIFVLLIIPPFILLIAGVSLILMSLGVYVRDTAQIIPIATQALMFMSPVLYPLENVPRGLIWLVSLNPLTFIVEQARSTMFRGVSPDWKGLLVYWAISIMVLWLGSKFFKTVRPGFADVV